MLNQAENSSSEPIPQSPLVQKIESRIWAGMDQKNILNQAFSIIPDNLRILRIVSILAHIAVFIWIFLSTPSPLFSGFWNLICQIGIWGVFMNTAYFASTFLFQNAGPYNLSWKLTYILGEISSAFAFLICPVFLVYLLPTLLLKEDSHLGLTNAVLYMIIHIVCPILIWADIFFTYYVFPKQHLKCLLVTIFCYGIFNLLHTMISGPVYNALDWTSLKSYLFLGIGFVMIVCGYFLGNLQYRWKMRKESKSIVTTLQLNEVSSPDKLSQYAPISYDF